MLLSESVKYSDKEIIEKGSRALIKEIGYTGFIRYIRQIESISNNDYVKVQDDIYKDMSVDEVFEKASDTWNNNR